VEALEARSQAQEAERQALAAQRHAPAEEHPTATSAASATSPGVGSDSAPRAQAAAGAPETQPSPLQGAAQTAAERPEVLVGAAFVGAFLFARILRAITGDDD
jgi:predicted lipid-binding transport protein (Tim44 family)